MCISGIARALCTLSVCRILSTFFHCYVFFAEFCCCPYHCDLCSKPLLWRTLLTPKPSWSGLCRFDHRSALHRTALCIAYPLHRPCPVAMKRFALTYEGPHAARLFPRPLCDADVVTSGKDVLSAFLNALPAQFQESGCIVPSSLGRRAPLPLSGTEAHPIADRQQKETGQHSRRPRSRGSTCLYITATTTSILEQTLTQSTRSIPRDVFDMLPLEEVVDGLGFCTGDHSVVFHRPSC